MNYYELTPHELDRVGEKRGEAARSYAIAAFFAGLAADTVKDFAFNPPTEGFQQGAWFILLILSVIATAYFGKDGLAKTKGANSFLQKIKDEHDFTP